MRFKNLILWDMRFQIKYGFYFIYGVLTILYVMLLSVLPVSWREKAADMMIFSDPAAMGLFFMGAIVLLEKSQRVLNALSVSPVKTTEYILSKIISIGFISVLVALILAVVAGVQNIPAVLMGTALASVIFTLLGLVAATKIKSLNQFIFITVPIEMVCLVPPCMYLFGFSPSVMRYYPTNVCISLIMGETDNILWKTAVTVLFILLLFWYVHRCTVKMWKSVGGARL